MPLYVFKAVEGGCETCREPFEVLRSIHDPPLTECESCGAEIEKQVVPVNSSFPKGPAELRNLGFARLEKRNDGTYENVSAQAGAQRHGSLESFSDSLTKGPRKIISG